MANHEVMSAAAVENSLPISIDQHSQVVEWIAQMRTASQFLYGEANRARILELADYYRRQIRPHFTYEEQILFPRVRELEPDPELHARLAEFEREHEELLLRLDILIEDLIAVAQDELNGPDHVLTTRRARLGIDLLLLHAAHEDEVLMPLFEKHREALGST